MKLTSRQSSFRHQGFTLVEIMVSTAVLALLMAMLLGTVSQTNQIWRRTSGKISQFQSSRTAFDAMTRSLSQATLNTYWIPNPPKPTNAQLLFRWVPTTFARASDLHFVSAEAGWLLNPSAPDGARAARDMEHPTHGVFFQAPLGATEVLDANSAATGSRPFPKYDRLEHLLTAVGYYLEWGKGEDRPDFLDDLQPPLPARWRMRLMEVRQPTESLGIFAASGKPTDNTSDVSKATDWIQLALGKTVSGFTGNTNPPRIMAENIVALIILPKKFDHGTQTNSNTDQLDLAPDYYYNSRPAGNSGKVKDGLTEQFSTQEQEWLHQLPPVVQVTMVAVDERSAELYQSRKSSSANADIDPPEWTSGLFTKAPDTEALRDDLAQLEKSLRDDRMNYRVFSADVVIRGSKWTHEKAD